MSKSPISSSPPEERTALAPKDPIQFFETQLGELNKKIASLNVSEKEKSVQNATKELDEAKNESVSYSAQKTDLQTLVGEIKTWQVAAAQQRRTAVKERKEISDSLSEIKEKLRVELKEQHFRDITQAHERVNQKIQAQKDEHEKLKNNVKSAKEDAIQMQQKAQQAEADLQEVKDQLRQLQTQILTASNVTKQKLERLRKANEQKQYSEAYLVSVDLDEAFESLDSLTSENYEQGLLNKIQEKWKLAKDSKEEKDEAKKTLQKLEKEFKESEISLKATLEKRQTDILESLNAKPVEESRHDRK